MLRPCAIVVCLAAAQAAGCMYPGEFVVSGSVRVAVLERDGVEPVQYSGFEFPRPTRVALPDGTNGDGFAGRCSSDEGGRVIRIQRVGGEPAGLCEVVVVLPDPDAPGSFWGSSDVRFTLGEDTFGGEAPGACEVRVGGRRSGGEELVFDCRVTTWRHGWSRVEIHGALSLDGCG